MTKKYRVWMQIAATACVEVEAESEEEAKQIAEDENMNATISLCHQCSHQVSEPTFGEAIEALEL